MERKQSIRTEKIKHDSLKIGNEQKRKTKEETETALNFCQSIVGNLVELKRSNCVLWMIWNGRRDDNGTNPTLLSDAVPMKQRWASNESKQMYPQSFIILWCLRYERTSRAASMVNEKVCTPIMDTSLALPIEVDIVTSQWQTINPNENLGWKLKNVFLRHIAVEEVFAEHAPVVVQHKMERMWRIVQFWP